MINRLKTSGKRAASEEHFQYDTTSAFRRAEGMSRFLRPASVRRQVLQVAMLALWGLVLIVVVLLVAAW